MAPFEYQLTTAVFELPLGISGEFDQEGVSFGMNSMRATVEREAIMHDRGK